MKKGFTLLEVLVAIVIITSVIIAVFQIFSLGFGTLAKLHTYENMYLTLTNLLEDINQISDFETDKGKRGTAGGFRYEWQAAPASPAQRMTGGFENPSGLYDIILYKIILRIFYNTKGGTDNYREFTFYKTGWRLPQK
jgi:prepilin-type N-terminal cleavage/methylation domain-containing protein